MVHRWRYAKFCTNKCAKLNGWSNATRKKQSKSRSAWLRNNEINIDQRFWNKVNKQTIDGCWEWIGCKDRLGYGRLMYWGTLTLAHRFSWELHNKKIPKGLNVLHKCDNRKCVNPEHLWLGTHRDNMEDMVKKGRSGNRYTISRGVTREVNDPSKDPG